MSGLIGTIATVYVAGQVIKVIKKTDGKNHLTKIRGKKH